MRGRVNQGHGKRPWLYFVLVGVTLSIVAPLAMAVGFVNEVLRYYAHHLPDVRRLAHHQPSLTTRIYSTDGKLIATLFHENRVWVPLERIPASLTAAVLASEDSRFYEHHGVDPVGVVRSVVANVVGLHEEGASTLTMQLARAVFLTPERTVERKVKEMLLAQEIERHFSKSEILELYLNEIYLGSGAYGVEAASETYFGKPVQRLNLAEAALIAGLPPAPTSYSPHVDLQSARYREVLVLHRMEVCGMITGRDMSQALHLPLHIVPPKRQVAVLKYPYFTSYVVRLLSQQFSPRQLYGGGLRVYTTLDTRMQALAEKAVQDGIDNAERAGYNVHQGALVAIEPATGYVKAMVGGRHWSVTNQFNRAWQAVRQPGSTFKIFVYATAFELGFTPDSIILDVPASFQVVPGQWYTPKNSDGRFWGAMPIARALQYSRDVPALRMANQLGLQNVINLAQRMGISEHFELNLPIALGSTEVTPLELASAVSTLPNRGAHLSPTVIKTVKDPDGHLLADYRSPLREQVITEQTAMALTSMMEKVVSAGTGTLAQIGRPAAGKTGTTDSHRDAWFVGFTPDLLAAVWTGNDDYSVTSGAYGGTVAAPIWAQFMKAALERVPPHPFGVLDHGQVGVLMCADSHERAGASCQHTYRAYFAPDKVPDKYCTLHTLHSVGSGYAFVNRYRFSLTGYQAWLPDRTLRWTFPAHYVSWDTHRTVPPAPRVAHRAVPVEATTVVVATRRVAAYTPRRYHVPPPEVYYAPRPKVLSMPPAAVYEPAPPPPLVPPPQVAPPVYVPPPPPSRRPRYVPPPPQQKDTSPLERRSRQDEDMDFERQ